MNFIDVALTKEGDSVYTVFGETRSEYPKADQEAKGFFLYWKRGNHGCKPEDLHDEEIFLQSAADSTIKAYVDVVELIGSETTYI